MPGKTFHLLTESEPFSEFSGGAISRWVGNIVRGEASSVVVCPAADETWQLSPERITVLPRLAAYKQWRHALPHLSWPVHCQAIRHMFQAVIRRLAPGDVVWVHNRPEFALALAQPIHRAGARVVLYLQNAHLTNGPEQVMRQVRVDRLIFISDFLLQQAQCKFATLSTASVLHSAADESIFFPAATPAAPAGTATVLFAGRLVEEKGIHVLLQAMALLQQQAIPLRAQIVGSSSFGEGKETRYIRQLKAAAPPTVEFLPYRSGAALGALFRNADIFCSPGIWDEPFGLVNVEALASGLPVVSTFSGGSREIFALGGGIAVKKGSAEELASALKLLALNPLLRKRMGQQGHAAFLQHFTWAKARDRVLAIDHALRQHAMADASIRP